MVKCPECNWENEVLYRHISKSYAKSRGMCANCIASDLVVEGYIEIVDVKD